MKTKTLGLILTLSLSALCVTESKADEKRDRAKREFLSRPVFQNNLTPEAHMKSGSVPPVEVDVALNARPTGEQVEPRTPASEVVSESAFVNPDSVENEPDVQASEPVVERKVSSSSNPFVWILPLLGLFAVSFYFVKRRK